MATDSSVHQALAPAIDARSEDWTELLRRLIAFRSVFGEEHPIADFVRDRLIAFGIAPIRVPHDAMRLASLPGAERPFSADPSRYSVVARLPGRGGGRSLAFNVHLDIVPEGDFRAWRFDPFSGEIDGGAIFGRGAMDDKAGVAIALALAETLATVPLVGDIVFQFVLEDETTGNGSLLCLAAGHGADAAVIIDGTRPDRAIDRHAGQLQVGVSVIGRPASVSVSHLGLNAADLLARLMTRLADAVAALNAGRVEPWTRFPSPFQLVTQRLASEGAPLTVPEAATATCYVTFPPPWTIGEMRAFLEQETRLFARERGLPTVPALSYSFSVEPVASDAAALGALLADCASHEGFGGLEIGPSTGTSDMRHFAAAGIPCLLYGPGHGFNPHRPDEHYRLSDLPRMVKVFTRLAVAWCGLAVQPDHESSHHG